VALRRRLAAELPPAAADEAAQTLVCGLFATRWLSRGAPDADLVGALLELLRGAYPTLLATGARAARRGWLDEAVARLRSTDVAALLAEGGRDPLLRFHEELLAAYDPRARAARGVWTTPDEVVRYVVDTTHTALQEAFGLPLGLADTSSWGAVAARGGFPVPDGVEPAEPFVQILDPATGSGAFLVRAVEVIHAAWQQAADGAGGAGGEGGADPAARRARWADYVRRHLLPRLGGFELLAAPWLLCRLRLAQLLEETGFTFGPEDRLRVFRADALAPPGAPRAAAGAGGDAEADAEADADADDLERLRGRAPVTVLVGNPPYEREAAARGGAHGGGWVRDGWAGWRGGRPLLADWLASADAGGRSAGVHHKNLYNLYVYFWRWATWRVFERHGGPGLVSFVTASSYLRGPGFAGMREALRRCADDIFVLDLEGDRKGARRSEGVFDVRVPVAIGTVLARGPCRPDRPAAARHFRVEGDRAAKLAFCGAARRLADVPWSPCDDAWRAELVPAAGGSGWARWPALADLFPWQHSGAQFKRKWVIAESPETLAARWEAFTTSPDRARAFRETRDRTIARPVAHLLDPARRDPPLAAATAAERPPVARYGYRSFDRQWAFADARLGDFLRPPLWQTAGPRQVYLASLLTKVLGAGPAAVASAHVPDLDVFCNRGGRDVIPLWRDPQGRQPNVAAAALSALAAAFGASPAPADVLACAYAVLAGPGYVARFAEELQVPGPRLPLPRDPALFARGAALGRELLRWHTYGERFREPGDGFALDGAARVVAPIPDDPTGYPERYEHDAATATLRVGAGAIAPVPSAVFGFTVSGLPVVRSWLDYRLRRPAGRRSSPLDDLRPARWTPALTRELLELLWVLAATAARAPALDAFLAEVLAGEVFTAAELGAPTAAERRPPGRGDPGAC
jgi:hypothetical protein